MSTPRSRSNLSHAQYTGTSHHTCTDRGPVYWHIAPCMYRPWANILAHRTMHVQTVGQYTGTSHHACTAHGPIYWHIAPYMYSPWASILVLWGPSTSHCTSHFKNGQPFLLVYCKRNLTLGLHTDNGSLAESWPWSQSWPYHVWLWADTDLIKSSHSESWYFRSWLCGKFDESWYFGCWHSETNPSATVSQSCRILTLVYHGNF